MVRMKGEMRYILVTRLLERAAEAVCCPRRNCTLPNDWHWSGTAQQLFGNSDSYSGQGVVVLSVPREKEAAPDEQQCNYHPTQ